MYTVGGVSGVSATAGAEYTAAPERDRGGRVEAARAPQSHPEVRGVPPDRAIRGADRVHVPGVVADVQGPVVQGGARLDLARRLDVPHVLAGLGVEREHVSALDAEEDLAVLDDR